MSHRVVGHLIAHALSQPDRTTVLQLGLQFALEHEENVAPFAPVVGHVAWAVVDHPNASRTRLHGTPDGNAGRTRCSVLGTRLQSVVVKGRLPNCIVVSSLSREDGALVIRKGRPHNTHA